MGKKDEYRFTIRFDPDDDRHRLVAKILNSQGRPTMRRGMLPVTRSLPQIIKEESRQNPV